MLNIPENIKELFRSNNNRVEAVKYLKLRFYERDISLLFPDNLLFPSDGLFPIDMEPFLTIENDRISTESFTFTESLCESENLKFGECNASKIEITVADVTLDVTGKEFLATVEIGGYELPFGIYRVESFIRQADRRMRKITAYDRMRRFQKDVAAWYNALSFPVPLRQFRNDLCEFIGVKEVSASLPLDDMQITKTIEPQQISGLDVLQAICEINGCFGHMDKTGNLKYINLSISSLFPENDLYPSEDLYPAEMLNAENVSFYRPQETTYEDYLVYGVDKVQIRQEEGDVGAIYGDGQNGYIIQGNFLVYGKSANELLQIAAALYDKIRGRTYRPCKISCPAFPWVEVGDGLICHMTNDVIETFCMKRTISGIQAMKDIFEATGSQKREEDFGINTQIIQLEGKAAVIKKSVEEVSVKVTDLKEYTEAQFKITAEQISAEIKRAQEAEAALVVRADQIAMSVKDLKAFTEANLKIQADQIAAEVKRAKDAEANLTIRAEQISMSVTNLKNYTESQLKITANEITAEVKRAQQAEANLKIQAEKISTSVLDLRADTNSRFEQTAGQIAMKVSKGDVSSQLSVESGKITLSGNRLIVNSTNFKLDGNGNATFSGDVIGASISGGLISGTDISVGLLNADEESVEIGGFYAKKAWGRNIFQSFDQKTGISAEPSGENVKGKLYLWAGWNNSDDFAFAVNNLGQTHAKEIWLEEWKVSDLEYVEKRYPSEVKLDLNAFKESPINYMILERYQWGNWLVDTLTRMFDRVYKRLDALEN